MVVPQRRSPLGVGVRRVYTLQGAHSSSQKQKVAERQEELGAVGSDSSRVAIPPLGAPQLGDLGPNPLTSLGLISFLCRI